MLETTLNISGNSETVEVRLASKTDSATHNRKVIITRADGTDLIVYLEAIEQVTPVLYHIDLGAGDSAMLIIPVPSEHDDGC